MNDAGNIAQNAQAGVNNEIRGAKPALDAYCNEGQEDGHDDKKNIRTAAHFIFSGYSLIWQNLAPFKKSQYKQSTLIWG